MHESKSLPFLVSDLYELSVCLWFLSLSFLFSRSLLSFVLPLLTLFFPLFTLLFLSLSFLYFLFCRWFYPYCSCVSLHIAHYWSLSFLPWFSSQSYHHSFLKPLFIFVNSLPSFYLNPAFILSLLVQHHSFIWSTEEAIIERVAVYPGGLVRRWIGADLDIRCQVRPI